MSIINFNATDFMPPGLLGEGAVSDDQPAILRKFLSPALAGPGWDALMAGISAGDAYVAATAQKAASQLYKCSASGIYLDRILSDDGFPRPANIGMSDRVYRNLGIKTGASKVVIQPLLEALAAYYGDEATRALVIGSNPEPYHLRDGDQLLIQINEGSVIAVDFEADDFGLISAATALEVAAAITSSLRRAGSSAYSLAYKDPDSGLNYVRIFSGALGLGGAVRIRGGRSQNLFMFPTQIETTQAIGTVWNVQPGTISNGIPTDRVRFTYAGTGTSPNVQLVNVGDYVNVFGSVFAAGNHGAFDIVATTATYFEVMNPMGSTQTGLPQAAADDILFFAATKKTIQSQPRMATAIQGSASTVDVILPATTDAIERVPNSGAYLHQQPSIDILSGSRGPNGIVTLTTDGDHNLVAGDWIFVDELIPEYTTSSFATISFTGANPSYEGSAAIVLPNGKILVAGGIDTMSAPVSDSFLYDPQTNTWATILDSMFTARTGATLTMLPNGKALIVGGSADSNALCELYDYVTNTWSDTGKLAGTRNGHSATLLNDGTVIVVGGEATGLGSNSAEIYDPSTGAWTPTLMPAGNISGHAATLLRDGRLLVCGGIDDTSTTVATTRIYSPLNGIWSLAGNMATSRGAHSIINTSRGTSGSVYVFGGRSNSGATTAAVEEFNPSTLQWTTKTSMLQAREGFDAILISGGRVFLGGGYDTLLSAPTAATEIYDLVNNDTKASTSLAEARTGARSVALSGASVLISGGSSPATTPEVYAERNTPYSSGGCIGMFRVVTAPTATAFTYATEILEGVVFTASGVVTAVKQGTDAISGPFVFDEKNGVPVTAIETTLTMPLAKGQNYKTIAVTSASAFPDAVGYLVFAFGADDQIWPVKYLGKASSTSLFLDPNFTMPQSLASGLTVTLLSQRGSWIPAGAENLGAFYVTASSAGRIAASAMIDDLVAAGLDVNKIVVYPGDKGLGGEGLPAFGANKLSDKVSIWGSDDVDADLEAARQE